MHVSRNGWLNVFQTNHAHVSRNGWLNVFCEANHLCISKNDRPPSNLLQLHHVFVSTNRPLPRNLFNHVFVLKFLKDSLKGDCNRAKGEFKCLQKGMCEERVSPYSSIVFFYILTNMT